jgi:hypothetical protein
MISNDQSIDLMIYPCALLLNSSLVMNSPASPAYEVLLLEVQLSQGPFRHFGQIMLNQIIKLINYIIIVSNLNHNRKFL